MLPRYLGRKEVRLLVFLQSKVSIPIFVVGQVIDRRLVECPHVHRVLCSSASVPDEYFTYLVCDLSKCHCEWKGRRFKLSSSVRILEICPVFLKGDSHV